MIGKIVKKIEDKGFGFIAVEGQEKNIFFHSSELKGGLMFDTVQVGDMVTFEIANSDKGPKATNVMPMPAADAAPAASVAPVAPVAPVVQAA